MKKVLALVLAVALSLSMASVAFAAVSFADSNPGDKIKIPVADINDANPDLDEIEEDYLSTDYFSIKVDYTRGKDLVKDVKFDKGDVVITLKDDVLEAPSVPNFQIKAITLTGKKNGVEDGTSYRNKKYTLDSADLTKAQKIGYAVSDAITTKDDTIEADDFAKEIVKIKQNSGEASYNTYTINFDEVGVSAEVRLYKNEKFFFGTSTEADLDIVKANPDADLEFITFKGKPSFSANANVEIYADEDSFLYEIKDGKLVASSLKYDDDAGAFVGKVRTLGKYVISDIKLVAASTTEESKNPDTGANDVVGVAVALAVVSLVAAGAVSMKK